MDKYLLRISSLYPFVNNELAISRRTTNWETWNSTRAALRLTFGRMPRLSKIGLRVSRLGGAYQFCYGRWAWALHIKGQADHELSGPDPGPIE